MSNLPSLLSLPSLKAREDGHTANFHEVLGTLGLFAKTGSYALHRNHFTRKLAGNRLRVRVAPLQSALWPTI